MKNTPIDYDNLQNPTKTNILCWWDEVLYLRAQYILWFHALTDEAKVWVAVNWRSHSQSVLVSSHQTYADGLTVVGRPTK